MCSTPRSMTRDELRALEPMHDSFVGIDSDGCVFGTMEVKQKQCFHGLIVAHWNLDAIAPLVRETAEFVNLYSRHRGQNRFPALLMTFDLLRERPAVTAAGVTVPALDALRRFIGSSPVLSNQTLATAARSSRDRELQAVLNWSEAVNARIEQTVSQVPPFPWARESLAKIRGGSDAVCISQTPFEALAREWAAAGLLEAVRAIAGQELGTKAGHLALAAGGKYAPDRILMIGDSPGDLEAARAAGACFYPINPGHEADSWQRFYDEDYDRFLAGAYAGPCEIERINEFNALLPETPPWVSR